MSCATCIYNDDGLCDCVGILVDDEDSCPDGKPVETNQDDLRR